MKVIPEWSLRQKIDKTRIPYQDIDLHIREVCRLLNSLPFLATTSSCEGHPHFDGNNWVASGGISLEIYDDEKYHILIGLLDMECQSNYEGFNIGISRGLRYSTQGFIFYTDGIQWSTMALTKEECEEQLKSIWNKLEYYVRKYLELEKHGVNWEEHLKWRKC